MSEVIESDAESRFFSWYEGGSGAMMRSVASLEE